MKLDTDVMNTSIEYFKRFYLKQSIYDFDPIQMMFTCVYLAIKVEETNYKLVDFVHVNTGSKIESIIKNETLLIKGLKFQFFIYSPYRAFDGYFQVIQDNLDKIEIEGLKEKIEKVKEYGYLAIRHLHYTDANFLYPPSLIGIAALFSGLNSACEVD